MHNSFFEEFEKNIHNRILTLNLNTFWLYNGKKGTFVNFRKLLWLVGLSLLMTIYGCADKQPECASESTKDTVVKLLRELSEKKDGQWYLQATFESISTAEKSDDAIKCNSMLILKASPYFGDYSEKLNAVYTVTKNEAKPDTNMVQLFIDQDEVHRINYAARLVQETFNYKKFNLEYLSSEFYENLLEQAEKEGDAEAEKISSLGALGGGTDRILSNLADELKNKVAIKKLIEYYDPEKLVKQLEEDGWVKFGTKQAGYTWAYKKDQRYTLLIALKKHKVKGAGFMGGDANVTLVDPERTTLIEGI